MPKRKTTKEYKQEVFDLVGKEYSVLGKYFSNRIPVLMRHNICGYEWKVRPYDFLRKESIDKNGQKRIAVRCPKCANKKRAKYLSQGKTDKQYAEEVCNLSKGDYGFIDHYIDNKTKVKHIHYKCGRIFSMRPNDFQQGYRCPYCKRSSGEKTIASLLEKWEYKYETEVSFSDCRYKNVLRFDFQIFLNDGTFILIEYNGKQHYKKMSMLSEEEFNIQQKRDQIKQEYCKKHSIPLYIIRYDEDIEKRLEEILM